MTMHLSKNRLRPIGKNRYSFEQIPHDIFERGINKGHGIHTLRHTFAPPFISGTDLYTIKRLLGHSSIKTTIIYLHLIPERFTKKSPLDTLYEEQEGEHEKHQVALNKNVKLEVADIFPSTAKITAKTTLFHEKKVCIISRCPYRRSAATSNTATSVTSSG